MLVSGGDHAQDIKGASFLLLCHEMDWPLEEEDDCPTRVGWIGPYFGIHQGRWDCRQREVEDLEEASQRFERIVERFVLLDSGALFCEEPHKQREAETCLWIPREVPWGIVFV